MTAAAEMAPAAPLDEALYKPLEGGAPMGKPLSDEAAMQLALPVPDDPDAARNALAQRRDFVMELLERSRDLRLYVRLFEIEARLRGLPGFHAGLHLLDAVVRGFWDELHPAPPGEGDARIARMTALGVLRNRRLVWQLDQTILFDAGGFDRAIALRTFYLATERHTKTRRFPPRDGETVYPRDGLAGIIARSESAAAVVAAHAAVAGSSALLRGLGDFFAKTEEYGSIRLADLAADMDVYIEALAPFLPVAAPEAASAPDDKATMGDARGAASGVASAPEPGALRSRAEALALIDAVLGYYAREARSSPVALALLKIRSMMDATFDQWMKEVASSWPDSVALGLTGVDIGDFTAPEPPAEEAPAPAPSPALAEALDAAEAALAALKADETVAQGAEETLSGLEAALAAARAAAPAEERAAEAVATAGAPAAAIGDRADVRLALRQLSVFFRTVEPSSPAYLCFEKLLDLVDHGFLDILRQVAPEGVSSAALMLTQTQRTN